MWNPFKDLAEGALEGFGKTVKDAVGAFKADPTKLAELEQSLDMAQVQLAEKVEEAAAKALESVNATMREEAKSEHWMVWSWRPLFGFAGAGILINNYILLPYFSKVGVLPIPVPSDVWLMVMAVLGVAAWTRGQEKVERVKHSGN